ncbi:hypothetical protein [Nitrosovibrio tenuis]|uniref:hypothetical protein n=1 Tax=Nitrosovibrio tenuis TaxID=1233 RepID=UPI0015A5C64C|nr:hypothetical protein [Nitrosovibrio tenuis]
MLDLNLNPAVGWDVRFFRDAEQGRNDAEWLRPHSDMQAPRRTINAPVASAALPARFARTRVWRFAASPFQGVATPPPAARNACNPK